MSFIVSIPKGLEKIVLKDRTCRIHTRNERYVQIFSLETSIQFGGQDIDI